MIYNYLFTELEKPKIVILYIYSNCIYIYLYEWKLSNILLKLIVHVFTLYYM